MTIAFPKKKGAWAVNNPSGLHWTDQKGHETGVEGLAQAARRGGSAKGCLPDAPIAEGIKLA